MSHGKICYLDIDLLSGNSKENAEALYQAVKELLGHQVQFTPADLEKPKKKIPFTWTDYDLDILTSVDGLDFDRAYRECEHVTEGGIVVPVVSRNDLIFIKTTASVDWRRCDKELADISFLKQGAG